MKNHRTRVLGLIAVVLLTGMAAAQNSVTPVPHCGNPQIENDTLFIVNPCSFPVNVTFTSLGDVWGGMPIGPGQHARTGYSGEAVKRVGEIQVYTCPGNGTPVQPDGSAIISGYTGRQYGCHGSAQDQSGLNSNPQLGQTPQQQVQQSLSNPAPANPWNSVVIAPAGSDGVVQQSNNVQQATDDDDDEAQDTDADNDDTEADQSAALQQEYQLMRQNLNAAMQEAARNASSKAGSGGRANPSQCQGPVGGGWCR
jgi:hypothetical protein